MMKKILNQIAIAVIMISNQLIAQTVLPTCPENTVTTKPGANGSTNTWDWRVNPIPVLEKISPWLVCSQAPCGCYQPKPLPFNSTLKTQFLTYEIN